MPLPREAPVMKRLQDCQPGTSLTAVTNCTEKMCQETVTVPLDASLSNTTGNASGGVSSGILPAVLDDPTAASAIRICQSRGGAYLFVWHGALGKVLKIGTGLKQTVAGKIYAVSGALPMLQPAVSDEPLDVECAGPLNEGETKDTDTAPGEEKTPDGMVMQAADETMLYTTSPPHGPVLGRRMSSHLDEVEDVESDGESSCAFDDAQEEKDGGSRRGSSLQASGADGQNSTFASESDQEDAGSVGSESDDSSGDIEASGDDEGSGGTRSPFARGSSLIGHPSGSESESDGAASAGISTRFYPDGDGVTRGVDRSGGGGVSGDGFGRGSATDAEALLGYNEQAQNSPYSLGSTTTETPISSGGNLHERIFTMLDTDGTGRFGFTQFCRMQVL